MKKFTSLLLIALLAGMLQSCCSLGGLAGCCNKSGKIVKVGCENKNYVDQEVTRYKTVKRLVYPTGKGSKGGVPYEVDEQVAYTDTVRVEVKGAVCGSTYCPANDDCGIVSPAVLKRASAQGWSGEPHIGLIPTMKVLAD